MTKEIESGNRLIAEFMGYRLDDKFSKAFKGIKLWTSSPDFDNPLYKLLEGNELKQLYFHSSWDWLMPVVEKIKNISIEQFYEKKKVMNALYDVDINILWQAVVEFIKWYNTTKTNTIKENK